MDANTSLSARRAWIEIPVTAYCAYLPMSLSARRAWIEIEDDGILSTGAPVALRKESVDRNSIEPASIRVSTTSLSARRAWIEMRA